MKKYLYIGTGGILGAILRFVLEGIPVYHDGNQFPFNTLTINVTGSFALALLLTVAFEVREVDADIRLGIGTGFLGAYTTFSTLCREAVELMRQEMYFPAAVYIILSIVLGLIAVYSGAVLARKGVSRLKREEKLEGETD